MKPIIPLHAWSNCREILKNLNGNPHLFYRTRQTLIDEVRARAILLLETLHFLPGTAVIDEIRVCLDSLQNLRSCEITDFPVERQLELIPTVSPSGVVA